MFDRSRSLQSSDSPYLRSATTSEEHSAAVAEMVVFESMESTFGQTFSPFVDDNEDNDDD